MKNEEKQSVQVLVATMNQDDHQLMERMNIQTDALVGNQCDRNGVEEFEFGDNSIKYFNMSDRGVGLNRNTALMRASADICILADDDMVFYEGYERQILDAYQKYPEYDVIILNIGETPRVRYVVGKPMKVTRWNYGRFGAARITFRRKAISYAGISFNLNFGGGATHSSGEDSLFLSDCLKAGLKIIAIPLEIAKLDNTDRDSTWFKGYTEKYFFDKGVFYGLAHPLMKKAFCLQYVIRHSDEVNVLGRKKALSCMLEGIKYV